MKREFERAITSCIRTIAGAKPGKKLAVFRMFAEEAFTIAVKGELDLQDVGDRLYGVGADLAQLDDELGDGWKDKLTATLGDAKMAALAGGAKSKTSQVAGPNGVARTLIVHRAADVRPEKIEWLWPGRVAVGKLTLIGGTPGLGKSQLTCFLAKVVSTSGEWPCREGSAPLGTVLILSAEDGLADTIIPRLTVAGADCGRVHVVGGVKDRDGRRSFDLKADLALLEAKAAELGDVRLIIIDPISAYLGGAIDGNDNVKVRNALEPLADMAARLRIAVVAITHLSKSSGAGQSALNRFLGSIAFVAAARAAFAVIDDANDKTRRLLLEVKNNLAKRAPGLAFRCEQAFVPEEDIVASRVCFESEAVEIDANEALAASEAVGGKADRTSKDDAVDFLRAVLADGPLAVKEIERQAVEAGLLAAGKPISHSKAMRSARDELGIKPHREGGAASAGHWVWAMPIGCR